jgi:peptidoglycan/xylan/chitin deacetylase (PgdA/CDA1 family)
MTDGMGPGPSINRYDNSILNDARFHSQFRYVPPLNLISCFDGGTGVEWTNEAGASVDDTVNFKRGTKSIKMLANNPRTHRIKKVGPWDFSDMDYFFFRTHSPQQSLLTTGLLYFNTGPSDYYSAWVGPKFTTWPATEEWFEWNCARFQFSKTGNADWSNIQYILFDAYCLGGEANVDISMDMLAYCKNPMPRGCVSIWLDDSGDTAVDNMKPYLDRYGYKMSVAWTAEHLGNVSELQTLFKEGHEISCHGATHSAWTGLTENQWNTEIVKWFRIAEKYGLLGQHHISAPPYGSMSYDVAQWCDKYFSLTRTAGAFGYDTWPFSSSVNGRGTQIDANTLAEVQTNLDAVATNRHHWNIILHKVGDGASYWTADLFRQLIEYIHSKGLDVKTYSQLLAEGIPETNSFIPRVVD